MSDLTPTPVSIPSSAASALIGDPAKFGYVAPDGTVFVKTSAGDKAVGSYPGKSPEEALSYFVRKFENVFQKNVNSLMNMQPVACTINVLRS